MVEVTLVLISASKKESRTDCRRFRQIRFLLLIGLNCCVQSWAIRQLAFISRYCGLVGVAVRKLEALPEEPVLIPRARVASRSPIVPATPPAPAKGKPYRLPPFPADSLLLLLG